MKLIAESNVPGEHAVSLFDNETNYCVVYGAHVKHHVRFSHALRDFSECTEHAWNCATGCADAQGD